MAKNKVESESIFVKYTPVLFVVTIILAFVVGFLLQKLVSVQNSTPTTAPLYIGEKLSEEQAKKVPVVTKLDHLKGLETAEIIMVEYSDLQCPYCKEFHPVLKQVYDEYGGKVAWVYRHFPITLRHPRAVPAAMASECVASLSSNDSFWKFIDTIFTDQTKYLTDEGLKEAAVSAGAKAGAFDACYKSNKFQSVIDSQYKAGEEAGVVGTPGTYIFNKKGEVWSIPGIVSYSSVKATIEEALKN